MKRFTGLYLLILFGILLLLPVVNAVVPFGATVSSVSNATAPADAAGQHPAIAGNVTEITLTAFTTTQSWQGYYGNVSGTIQLADASDNVLYNWSLASPEGEVYSTRNSSESHRQQRCKGNPLYPCAWWYSSALRPRW